MNGGSEPEPGRRLALLAGIALAAVAALGVLLFVATPDDGILDAPVEVLLGEDGPAVDFGTPGPMHGEPLDPGRCDDPGPPGDPSALDVPPPAAGVPADRLLWLRADRGIVLAEGGDTVLRWRDLSGAGHDLLAADAGAAPRFVARARDCFAAVRFAGRESLARGDLLGLAPEQGRSFVLVARLRDPVERSQLFSQGEPGGLQRHVGIEANTWRTAGGRFGVYVVGNSFDAPLATHRELALHLLSVDSLAPGHRLTGEGPAPSALAALQYRVDGAPQPLALRSGAGEIAAAFDRASRTTLGDFAGPAGFGYRGDVFELMVFGRVLDAREQRALEHDLAARYGIEVASSP